MRADYGTMAPPLGVEFTITAEASVSPLLGMHACFRALSHEAVRAFYAAALEAGGCDDGTRSLRVVYPFSVLGLCDFDTVKRVLPQF